MDMARGTLGDSSLAQGFWVSRDIILWQPPVSGADQYVLFHSPVGGLLTESDATLGNDTNTGTEAAPFKTIEQGLIAARSENNWSMTGDIIIYLRGGTYPVDEPIVLSSHDSGNLSNT